MDKAKVDLAIISLTTPSVYWAGKAQALNLAMKVNDEMSDKQRHYPDRLRFFATLPWQHPDVAVVELERSLNMGALGVFVGANIEGASLTEKKFATIWEAIDKRALPVLVHPAPLPGTAEMKLNQYNLIQVVGFMCDTTISISRMIFDGFFERYSNLNIIAAHVGGTLPYIVGRMDACYENMLPCRENIKIKPSEYLRRIYYDSIGFTTEAIQMCLNVGGEDRVMFGSDYPHLIGQMPPAIERVRGLSTKNQKAIFSSTSKKVFNL